MDLKRQLRLGLSSGELLLDPVPAEALQVPFSYCASSLALAMAKTDEMDMAQLLRMLEEERATLLVEWLDNRPQGCIVTAISDYPKFRALTVLAIAGLPGKTRMYPNADSMQLLRQWAEICGCSKIEGFANEAISRLWARIGFKEVSRLVRMDI